MITTKTFIEDDTQVSVRKIDVITEDKNFVIGLRLTDLNGSVEVGISPDNAEPYFCRKQLDDSDRQEILKTGYKNHKKLSVLTTGLFGLAVMILAYFFGEAVSVKSAEQVFTVVGSLVVVYAHYMNYRTCNDLNCDCHNSKSL